MTSFDSRHEDIIHSAQLDYYGTLLATSSSDSTVNIFKNNQLLSTLKGHTGPVWDVSWAHPKFGTVLATCSYDSSVLIWYSTSPSNWQIRFEHTFHSSSVNSIAWASHEFGLVLACASSDGKVSILSCKDDGSWDVSSVLAHSAGVNSVSWNPQAFKFVTGGCDNLIKIFKLVLLTFSFDGNVWLEEKVLSGHSDWVRDVAWSNSMGSSYIASCSQDKTVVIWHQNSSNEWQRKPISEVFPDVIWKVSWSPTGLILAVSCGDNSVSLFKENLAGDFVKFENVD